MARLQEEDSGVAGLPAEPADHKQAFVLVVDDDPFALEITRDILLTMGYRVETARDGLKAMECLQHRQYNIVVSDLQMPGMDGISLAHRIKQRDPQVHVVIMTGLAVTNVQVQMNTGVVDGWVFKPFDINELRCVLQQI
jgi:CheY-like chemotaxis protein